MAGHISKPGRENNGQSGSVRHIVHGTYFVFHKVRSPVLHGSHAARAVVCNGTCPHQVGTGSVVFRLFHYPKSFRDNGFERSLTHTVGHFLIFCIGEIAFHDVCHHVGHPASCLPSGEGIGQFRIHHGECRAQQSVRTDTQFLQSVQFRDDRITGTFTSSRRNSQDNTQWNGFFRHYLIYIEIPEIAFVRDTHCNGFGCIDNRTASHRKQKVDSFATSQLDTFVHFRVGRIGLNASQFHMSNACFVEVFFYFIE